MKTTNAITNYHYLKTTGRRGKGLLSLCCFLLIVLLSACQKDKSGTPNIPAGDIQQSLDESRPNFEVNISNFKKVDANMVLTWNNAATVAVTRMAPLTGSGPLPPMPEARIYAMVFVAMHDALNTIHPKYARYALTDPIQKHRYRLAQLLLKRHTMLSLAFCRPSRDMPIHY